MALDRTAIYTALFDRLQASVEGVEFWSYLAPVHYDELGLDRQPALELLPVKEQSVNKLGLPPRWTLDAEIILFVRNDRSASDKPAAWPLHDLVRQIEAALEMQEGEVGATYGDFTNRWNTTLGGLVAWCWISGAVEYVQGEIGGQGWARIPVQMMALTPAKG